MQDDVFNVPRAVNYSKENEKYYDEWLNSDSNTIFAGFNKGDLFIFAMAIGKNRGKPKDLKNKIPYINVHQMKEEERWALLSISISENKDLSILKNQQPLYSEAERYADEGINIIKSHMDLYGASYYKALESELRDILKKDKKPNTY